MTGAALVLVGHGSARHPDGAAPILALAEDIRNRRHFARVAVVFMKQDPPLAAADTMIGAAREVVVVPVFAGRGYYTEQLIPGELGLSGPVTLRSGRRWHYTEPLGTHPRIPALLAARAEAAAAAAGMSPADSALLLIAHGSARPGGAGETPRAIAAALRSAGRFAEVALVFLEQEPRAGGWRDLVGRRDVVAMPLLVGLGMHARSDIPPLFGLREDGGGPHQPDGPAGHRVVLAGGLGAEPALAELVVGMAEAALAATAG